MIINVIIRVERGYKNFILIDVTKQSDPNTDIKLTQRVCNVLLKKLPFTSINSEQKTLTKSSPLKDNEYDYIINAIKIVKHSNNIDSQTIIDKLPKHLNKHKIILKNRIKIYFDPIIKDISPELKDFFDSTSTINFIGWYTKFEHIYYFEFETKLKFNIFLKRLSNIDISNFTVDKLIQNT